MMQRDNKQVQKKLISLVGKAVVDFSMIRAGDRVLLAVSGGKDSMALAFALSSLKRRAPVDFSLSAVHVGSRLPAGFYEKLEKMGMPVDLTGREIEKVVESKVLINSGTSPCVLCSRLRRGLLYTYARERGFNVLALGHHADDIIESLILNQFFCGRIRAMPPVFVNDSGDIRVIRPLCFVFEDMIKKFADGVRCDFAEQECRFIRTDKNHSMRKWAKALISELERAHPGIKASLLGAVRKVEARFLFPDAIH